MSEEVFTWDAICAMDEIALNLTIEDIVYRRVREAYSGDMAKLYRLKTDMGYAYATLPDFAHTTSWDRTMALAWKYDIGLLPLSKDVVVADEPSKRQTKNETEQLARLAICRIALWRAIQEKAAHA